MRAMTKNVARAYLCLALWAWALCFRGFAQDETQDNFARRFWNRDSGLPDNQIAALFQSSDGYIWIATSAGLARFDGLTFTSYSHLTDEAFLSDRCTALDEDDEQNLWIGTTRGLIKRSRGVFSRLPAPSNVAGSPTGMVHWSPRSGLWILNSSYVWHKQGDQFVQVRTSAAGYFYSIAESPEGTIWIGSEEGLISIDPVSGEQKRFRDGGIDNRIQVYGIVSQPDGAVFGLVNTPGAVGVRPYFIKDDVWTPLSDSPIDNIQSSYFAYRARDGAIYLPKGKREVQRFAGGRFSPQKLLYDGVPSCVLEDREHNLWLGTVSDGLYCFSPKPFHTLPPDSPLFGQTVSALAETRDGIWLGTDEGLSRYAGGVASQFSKTNGLPWNTVRALAEDSQATLWIGTGRGIAALREGKPTSFPLFGSPREGDYEQVSQNKIRTLLTSGNHVWIAAESTLYDLHGETLDVVVQSKVENAIDFRALALGTNGALWVGTVLNGLCVYSNEQFVPFLAASDPVWAIYKDSAGVLWFGGERGLKRLENGRVTQFSSREGLPVNVINEIVEDDFGCLWLALETGIVRVSKAELNAVAAAQKRSVSYVLFDNSDGMPHRESTGQRSKPAILKRANGEMWFGTERGVAIINAGSVQSNLVSPKIVVQALRANDHPIFQDGRNLAVTQSGAEPGLVVAPGQGRVLEFQFAMCTFVAPEKSRFKFRLDGYDLEWRDAGKRRVAFYTNLSPGKYRFRVIGCDHHNLWSENEASLAFTLAPFFYQTWSFRVLAAAAVVSLVLAGHFYRVRHLRQIEQLNQELALARERSRVAKDLHDGVGSALTQVRLLSALAEREQKDSGAAHEAIRKIGELAVELNSNFREIIWLARPESQTLEGLLSRACEHAEALARHAGIRCSFDLPEDIPEVQLSGDLAQNLQYMLKEALHNAAKHSGATVLTLSASITGDQLVVSVQDDGQGFDTKDRTRGNGLGNMRARVESTGGTLDIQSASGTGTTISIHVPVAAGKSGI